MDNRLEKALLYIEENIQSDIHSTEVANAAGMSVYHFHRVFKNDIGRTPAQYILKTRILRAAHDLLILSEMSVIDAAFKYGFSSPSAFARSFKKIIGKTPSKFRMDRRAELGLDADPKVREMEKAYASNKPLSVRYMEGKTIAIIPTTLDEEKLNQAYQSLIKNKTAGVTQAISLFVEPPFGTLNQRPHLIGLDALPSGSRGEKTFHIPSGYYAHLASSGSMIDLQSTILSFRKNFLDPSSYESASTLFFETVPLTEPRFDYTKAQRTLFIKVRKK